MAKNTFSEIFNEVTNAPNDQARVEVLQKYQNPSLRAFIRYGMDPNFTFDVVVPEKFKRSDLPVDYADTSLYTESRRLYIFLSTSTHVNPKKKTELLLTLLEYLPYHDSILVEKVVTNQFSVPGLTWEVVNKAFPGLLPIPPEVLLQPELVEEVPPAVEEPKIVVKKESKKKNAK